MKLLFGALIAMSPLLAEQVSYEESQRDVNAYIAQNKDEQLFLDPTFREELADIGGKIVLDAGCGAWSIKAAREGAQVCALNESPQMRAVMSESDVDGQIAFFEGDVFSLPYPNETFDRILSLNVGANLPSSIHMRSEEGCGLEQHCEELARVMKEGGRMVLVAPASYDTVFTDDSVDENAAMQKIEKVLGKITTVDNPEEIVRRLEELQEVNRATFVRRGNRLVLVTDMRQLKLGEQIWRKEPSGIYLSYYHNEEEYLVTFRKVGLVCEEIKRPCFFGRVKYNLFHKDLPSGEKGLGSAYIENNPFTIYTISKPV
ncbi:MAG: class I SAM-dependent methyltransferase [Chlamydiales bacterium]|nr:class I SAM-dependent methyltransferase [Chlamydiales bacterium]